MPELPDVEVFKRYLDSTALHKRVGSVSVKDADLLEGVSGGTLRDRMPGRELSASRRHGKHLFVQAEDAGWLILHFGMTGFLKYFRKEDSAPEHVRLLLELDNGYSLAYDCQRKFGTVGWTQEPDDFIEEQDLGPDPLATPEFALQVFRDRLSGRRGSVKSTLMNQKVLAGIGNVYSDEILFQVGIHPERKVSDLRPEEAEEIYRAMNRVVEAAIRAQVDLDRFPKGYLLPTREEGAECPRCGGTLRKKTVGGRSAVFCPEHQG